MSQEKSDTPSNNWSMSKLFFAPHDFTPRESRELQFSKNDQILLCPGEQGWHWGCNLSRGRKEGWVPMAFIARPPYSRSKSGLEQAADRTALACSKVDDLVACSAFLPAPQDENRRLLQERKRRLYAVASVGGNGGCSGLAYLAASEPASSAAVAIWEGCFNSLLAAYRDGGADDANGGSYGDTGATLSSIAAELDRHIAALAHETGLHQGSDPSIMRNALEMQAALERFLASQRRISEAATKERESPSVLTPLRRRETTFTLARSSTVRVPGELRRRPTETVVLEPPATGNPILTAMFLHYNALRNLTFIVSLVSCGLQFSSFFRSTALEQQVPGLPSDPDFLTNLQTFFMQVLTTYTSLVPALRAELLVLPDDSSFAAVAAAVFWTALLAVATLTLNVASVAVYTYRAPLAPLLSFFGSVVQATAVLQLATRFGSHDVPVDEGVELAAGV